VDTAEGQLSRAGRGWSPARAFAWIVERPLVVLIALALVAMALNLWETRGQTFFSDEWSRFLYADKSVEALLRGHSGHLVLLNTVLYKGIFYIFGADSYLPLRVAQALLLGICGFLFYALARNWADAWTCVAATTVLLFLGSSLEVVATPTGTVNLMPLAFGLGALICLQRFKGEGFGDALACALLVASVASHSNGLAFLAGAAVMVGLQDRHRLWSRSWVIAIPALLYAAWLLWYRAAATATTQNVVDLDNVGGIPSTIVAAAATGLSAVSGLFGSAESAHDIPFNLEAGYLLLGLLIVGGVWRARSGRPIAREIWAVLALGIAFWFLLGLVVTADRPATASRYIYPSAVFLLLIIVVLVGRVRGTPLVIWGTAVAVLVSVVPNVIALNDGANRLRDWAIVERADLGAVELLKDEGVPLDSIPELSRGARIVTVGGPGFRFSPVTYFNAVFRDGSPAAGPQELASMPEEQRKAVDGVLLKGDGLTLTDAAADLGAASRRCRPAPGIEVGSAEVFRVPAPGLLIRPRESRSGLEVYARRFADGFHPMDVPAGSGPFLLKPAANPLVRPWLAQVNGGTVCSLP
jgi:hypothetical protein